MSEEFLEEFRERAVAGPCRVAIDIGANVGEWTRWLAERFDYVIALEPDPRAYSRLVRDLPSNVHTMNLAAGERHAAVDFYLRPDALQSSLLEVHPIGGHDQEDAPALEKIGIVTVPLDFVRFIAKDRFGCDDIDFVKIDCEGSEAAVLAGATPALFAKTRWLIEIHDTQVAVGQQLDRLGREQIQVIEHPASGAHPQHFWVFSSEA
jgi:FkbM family methyltransferase